MDSTRAIYNLECYIKTLKKKWWIYTRIEKGSIEWFDDRIKSALEQIELYKVGRGRLQQI